MVDLERQKFEDIVQVASNALYELSSAVRRLHKLCTRPQATPGLADVVADVATKCKTATQVISALNQDPKSLTPAQRQQQKEISAEFAPLVKEIPPLQQQAAVLLRKQAAEEAAAQAADGDASRAAYAGDDADETTPLVLEHLDENNIELHQQLIEERGQEIAQVHQGMNEINAIFSDLGTLIQEQGEQLDTVEDHVTDVRARTAEAQRELARADNYQRNRGRWSCYFLLALLAFTILVALTFL